MAKLHQVQHYNEPVEKQIGFAALVHTGQTLYLAGIVSFDMEMNVVGTGDMAAQLNQVYDIMEKTLAKSGATLADVVNEMMFTTDMQALTEAMGVRAARYADCAPPASTAVQVSGLFHPDLMIEIQVTAVLGE